MIIGTSLQLFLELWYAIPMGWRYVLMVVPVVVSVIASVVMWEWWVLIPGGVGSLILFCLPGPSESEKTGYNF